jgi:hypothetical protein
MLQRWQKLAADIYKVKKDSYDVSKVPDIYDTVKHDCRHNFRKLRAHPNICELLLQIHANSKSLADIIVPLEYGVTIEERVTIAAQITKPLRHKIIGDLRAATRMPSASPVWELHITLSCSLCWHVAITLSCSLCWHVAIRCWLAAVFEAAEAAEAVSVEAEGG